MSMTAMFATIKTVSFQFKHLLIVSYKGLKL